MFGNVHMVINTLDKLQKSEVLFNAHHKVNLFFRCLSPAFPSPSYNIKILIIDLFLGVLERLPPGLLRAVETLSDRLVVKAPQLVNNCTTNLCENFMSIHCKMDGGKFYNQMQRGSFYYRSMAAALRVQRGPNWLSYFWESFMSVGECFNEVSTRRKHQHTLDGGRKVLLKYKRRWLMGKTKPVQPDALYGQHCIQTDASPEELDRVCQDYISCLTVNEAQQQAIAIRAVRQSDDLSGEWAREQHGRLTASHFVEFSNDVLIMHHLPSNYYIRNAGQLNQ